MQNPPKNQGPPMRSGMPNPVQRNPGVLPRPGQPKPLGSVDKTKMMVGFMPAPQEETQIETKSTTEEPKLNEPAVDIPKPTHH
jgi:hypothetical protein